MELVPRLPSERVVRGVLVASIAATYAVTVGCAIDLARGGALVRAGAGAAGLLVGFVLSRPILRTDAASRAESALDRFECLAIVAGRSVLVAGLLALFARTPALRLLGAGSIVAAIALVALALVRDRARARFLERVYAKEHPSLRVERDADVRGYELLPPILSGMITDAVIAHVTSSASTYRTSGGPRPIARVTASLAKMNARLARRSRSAGMLVTGLAFCASIALVTPVRPGAFPHGSHDALVAPACVDAIPYFEDRLESLPGVGRATLVTHAQDPTVAEGHGVLLVAPHPSEATKASVLSVAKTFPCRDPLALTVEEPNYRAFDVRAELDLDPGADEAAVRRDAQTQIRELFTPDAHALDSEHVRFGDEEKSFGYRVRWVLHRVVAVRSAHVTVDGSDKDAPLGPRDFPTLRSLSVTIRH